MTDDIFPPRGEMAALMRVHDWGATPLGLPGLWPADLRSSLSICLATRFPIALYWGPEGALLYNDAWRPILGAKHPWALGRPAHEVWPEIWDAIGPLFQQVRERKEGIYQEDQLLLMRRHGYTEECYFNFTFSPVENERGEVGGVFNAVLETTERVIANRRLRTLREISGEPKTERDVLGIVARALEANPYDAPFAHLWRVRADGEVLELGHAVRASDDPAWRDVLRGAAQGRALVELPAELAAGLSKAPWDERPRAAACAAVRVAGEGAPSALLVVGVSPRRAWDEAYAAFVDQAAAQASHLLTSARALAAEQSRAAALAETDRVKTAFFANVSHEFRTPLTLMMGPLRDILERPDAVSSEVRADLALVQRNGLRLQRLVNTLLDFSKIEAGRAEASYEPTNLAELTRELASTFRAAFERADLHLDVHAPPLPEPVYVDRDMWEKIVLNLVSNAFKHTFAGGVTVTVSLEASDAILTVRDTGVGIPERELPHVFERFHRVRDARARTHEGTGIGLALVQQLARLHGGDVTVVSRVDRGTTFTVRVPRGCAHLPPEHVAVEPRGRSPASSATPFVEEALRWGASPTGAPAPSGLALDGSTTAGDAPSASRARVLLADDNADMRAYVQRLLSPHWDVIAVEDGVRALELARRAPPDLVLSDVMMPGLDGFELLRALRDDPRTAAVPVILLSARAGEQSSIDGLRAGANDYLVKPFSARELVARVGRHVAFGRALSADRFARERLDALFSQAPMAVCVVRGPDLRFELANAKFEAMVGRGDLVGRTVREAFQEIPEDAPVLRAVREARTSGHAFTATEFLVPLDRRGDGVVEDAYFHFTAQPLHDTDGQVDALMVVAFDVTDKVRLRQDAEAAAERERAAHHVAQEANRFKDEFLATVSHELRTPLNAIVGWASMALRDRDKSTVNAYRALEVIDRNARAQAQIIEDILDVSRIITGKMRIDPKPHDLGATLREAAEAVSHSATARDVRVVLDVESPLLCVCDANRMQQVAWNLLTNAIRHVERGGVVTVRLSRVGEALELAVSDDGRGIDPAFLPFVWDRFRQADGSTTRTHGGLGLGLAIVRHIVEMHGGTVLAESAGLGQGATFTVRVPAVPGRSDDASGDGPARASAPGPASSGSLAGRSVLVVDDEHDTRELVVAILNAAGARVIASASASEALGAARAMASLDVVVTDIGMPGHDGYWLLERFREGLPGARVPVVALTAYARSEDSRRALRAGFAAHVPKPTQPDTLIAVIADVVARASPGAARP